MTQIYDLVVIGSGVAASGVASSVRQAGWSVAVIDSRPFGGTCQLRGCDPKKMLLAGAEAVHLARLMSERGVAGDARIDWPSLMAFKRSFTDPVPAKWEQTYAEAGIAALHGVARFTGPDRISVNGRDLQARHVLIAAGARPVDLAFPGAEHVVTSDVFLELPELPRHVAMVGGGYIAAEFACLAARAGAQVTVLQRAGQMLTQFDPDLVGWLMQGLRHVGVSVRTETTVQAVEPAAGGGFTVRTRGQGGEAAVQADLVVHAAGRVPDLDALALDVGAVARDEHGRLRLNDFLQSTSNPRVYAAGDAASAGPPLTPVASLHAEAVTANLLHGNRTQPDLHGIPSVAFTLPSIAAVGLSEAAARAQGLRFRRNCAQAADWFTARRLGEPVYGYKVLIEEETDRILGAHLVGPHAEETINLFALVVRQGLPAAALRDMVFSYPTAASDLGSML